MSTDAEKSVPEENIPQEDWFLQILIDIVNSRQMSIGLTVNVGGFLISRLLIGGKAYFEGFAADLASAIPDAEASSFVKQKFGQLGDVYQREDKQDTSSPHYIHFKDAKFYHMTGEPIPGNRGVWWRGRISQVHGFVLGTLGEAPDS
jgi:hypothetical protein